MNGTDSRVSTQHGTKADSVADLSAILMKDSPSNPYSSPAASEVRDDDRPAVKNRSWLMVSLFSLQLVSLMCACLAGSSDEGRGWAFKFPVVLGNVTLVVLLGIVIVVLSIRLRTRRKGDLLSLIAIVLAASASIVALALFLHAARSISGV